LVTVYLIGFARFMGIRFLCPEGHKLNVKSFLAGKRAVCPKCGTKVVVPLESQSPELLATARGTESNVMPDVATGTAATPAVVAPAESSSPSPNSPTKATSAPATEAAQPTSDLLAEDPSAMWYMHHPSLGQFGPATPDIFREWLTQGRVSSDSLVWRAGWPEWQSASTAFPQYLRTVPANASSPPQGTVVAPAAAPAAAPVSAPAVSVAPVTAVTPQGMAPVIAAPVVAPTMAPVISAPTTGMGLPVGQIVAPIPAFGTIPGESDDEAAARVRRRRRKSNDAMMIASGLLVALILVLAVVLAVVLSQQSNVPVESKPRRRPASRASDTVAKPKPRAAAEVIVEPLEREPAPRDTSQEDTMDADMDDDMQLDQ
jgi:hypothetical protein